MHKIELANCALGTGNGTPMQVRKIRENGNVSRVHLVAQVDHYGDDALEIGTYCGVSLQIVNTAKRLVMQNHPFAVGLLCTDCQRKWNGLHEPVTVSVPLGNPPKRDQWAEMQLTFGEPVKPITYSSVVLDDRYVNPPGKGYHGGMPRAEYMLHKKLLSLVDRYTEMYENPFRFTDSERHQTMNEINSVVAVLKKGDLKP